MLSLAQKVVLFFCPVVFWSTHCFAQLDSNQRFVVDSLVSDIHSTKEDTTRIKRWIEIASIFYPVNKDSSKKYTNDLLNFTLEKTPYDLNRLSQEVYIKALDFSYENLGDIALRTGNLELATIHYEKCVDIKKKYGRKGIPHIRNNQTFAFLQLLDYTNAMESAISAIEWSKKIENPTKMELRVLGKSYNLIAGIYWRLENWDKCIEYTMKSAEILKEKGSGDDLANVYNNIGTFSTEENQEHMEAVKYFKLSLDTYKKIDNEKGEALVLFNLARTYFKMDSLEQTVLYLNRCLELSEKLDNVRTKITAYWLKGHLEYEKRNLDEAEKWALKSFELEGAYKGDSKGKKLAAALLVEIYVLRGDWEKAFFYKEEEEKVEKGLKDYEKQREVLELEAQYKVKEAKAEDSLTVKTQKLEIESKEEEIENLNQEKKIHRTGLYLVSGGTVVLFGLVLFRIRKYRQSVRIKETKAETEIKNLLNTVNLLQTNLNAKLKESTVIDGKILNERLSELMKTSLTKREMEVLIELCKGKENKEIAESLFISVNTVRTHLLKIYEKLDVKSRTQAIKKSENLSRIK